MTASILTFPPSRIKRIPPAVQQGYDDVRVEFARQIEQRAYALWRQQMAGERPGDTE